MEKISIGNKIRNFRIRNQLTQQQLASLIGVSNKAISKWENDEGYPDIQNLKRIAEVFNTTVDFLIIDQKQDKQKVFNRKSMNLILLLIISLSLMFAEYMPSLVHYSFELKTFVDKEFLVYTSAFLSVKNLLKYGVLNDNGFGIAMLVYIIFNVSSLILLLRGKLKTCEKYKMIYIVMLMLQVYAYFASLTFIQRMVNLYVEQNLMINNIPTTVTYISATAYILIALQILIIIIINGDKIVEYFRLRDKKHVSILLKILTSDNR
jgi:transcriptional regulator with XRE-family HTH domain